MSDVVVESLAFTEDGVQVQFIVIPEDVRAEGHVVVGRSMSLSWQAPAGLGAMAVDVRTAVVGLVEAALEQLPALEVYEPAREPAPGRSLFDPDDDEEDVGMGDGR